MADYFFSSGSVPQLSGAIPQFLGEMPQFLGELPQFSGELPQFSGELPQTQGGGIENVSRGQRNSATCPKSLKFAPESQVCDYSNKTTKRGVINVLQQHVVI